MSMTTEAIAKNISMFCEPLTDLELNQLSSYLCDGFMHDKPTPIQEEFVDEFFGKLEWAEFLAEELLEKKPFFSTTAVVSTRRLLGQFREFIFFEEHLRLKSILRLSESQAKVVESEKKLFELKIKKLELEKKILSSDLESALKDSYFDDVFDKIDGFCNIMDVLMKARLVKRPKREK